MGHGFYDELTAILKSHSYYFVRNGKGSHQIWFSPITKRNFSVPVTINKKGTFLAILRQAGIR